MVQACARTGCSPKRPLPNQQYMDAFTRDLRILPWPADIVGPFAYSPLPFSGPHDHLVWVNFLLYFYSFNNQGPWQRDATLLQHAEATHAAVRARLPRGARARRNQGATKVPTATARWPSCFLLGSGCKPHRHRESASPSPSQVAALLVHSFRHVRSFPGLESRSMRRPKKEKQATGKRQATGRPVQARA